MKVLFITGLYTRESESLLSLLSNGGIQNAPNAFQWSIIDGLSQIGIDYTVVSCPFLPSYPLSFKSLITPDAPILYDGKKVGDMMSYCNLLVYKTKSIQKNIRRFVEKWVSENKSSGEDLVILTYTPYPSFINALKNVRKLDNVIVGTIVTDLVDDMMNFKSNRSLLKRIQSFMELKSTKSLYKFIDKFILLTKAMEEKIPEAVGNNIVIEGISQLNQGVILKEDKPIRNILYTGTLEKFACVDILVKAFMKINLTNVKLTICGDGPLKQMICDAAKVDNRIDFRGLVSREEALCLQKDASILINPRQPDGGITKYSFPSKTMEYLVSGTPMIGYKLEGIPEEYFSYYYTVNNNDEEELVSRLLEVLTKPQEELNNMASSAYNFINSNKSAKIQVSKIIDFLRYNSK